MISNGNLTYVFSENQWLFAEFDSAIVNALVIAALSTILSYQATAIVFDLLLGLKEKKLAPINLFQVLLLVRRSSPVSVINSLLRRDWLTGIYFKGYLPERSEISRHNRPIRYSVTARLIILLIAAPLINIIAVVFTFENTLDVTFAQAQFGGVALGISPNNSNSTDAAVTTVRRLTERCQIYPILAQQGDNVQVQFSSCYSLKPPPKDRDSENTASFVSVKIVNWRDILITFDVGTTAFEFRKFAWLDTRSKTAGLQATVAVPDALSLVNTAVDLITPSCDEDPIDPGGRETRTDETAASVGHGEVALIAFQCNYTGREVDLRDILVNTGQRITLLDAERLLLLRQEKEPTDFDELNLPDFDDGTREVLLERRRRTISLTFMAGLAAMSLVLRLLLAVISNNDVHDGIERMIKERVGLKYCQSLLRHGNFRVMY